MRWWWQKQGQITRRAHHIYIKWRDATYENGKHIILPILLCLSSSHRHYYFSGNISSFKRRAAFDLLMTHLTRRSSPRLISQQGVKIKRTTTTSSMLATWKGNFLSLVAQEQPQSAPFQVLDNNQPSIAWTFRWLHISISNIPIFAEHAAASCRATTKKS